VSKELVFFWAAALGHSEALGLTDFPQPNIKPTTKLSRFVSWIAADVGAWAQNRCNFGSVAAAHPDNLIQL
jgi:hypothetical protein